MSNYVIDNGTFYDCGSDELAHYGVKGMRWGIRRNTKKLYSSDSAKRAKAASSLEKHREKAGNEITKLKAQNSKLEKRNENNAIKLEPKVAKLNVQAANYRNAANRMFVSNRRAQKYLNKAYVAETKAKQLTAYANNTKAKINKNNMLIKMFERGISDIDATLSARGKQYVNGDK